MNNGGFLGQLSKFGIPGAALILLILVVYFGQQADDERFLEQMKIQNEAVREQTLVMGNLNLSLQTLIDRMEISIDLQKQNIVKTERIIDKLSAISISVPLNGYSQRR